MENTAKAPDFLLSMLDKEYGEEIREKIISGYQKNRITSFRVNPLKGTQEEVLSFCQENGIEIEEYKAIPNAYIVKSSTISIFESSLVKDGKIYLQSLSSMLPPLYLDPKYGESILDMAAAPGGKTTEIAAMTENKAQITAIEVNKIRAERLKYNVAHQGATSVFVMQQDAKKLDDFFSFDRILLDAPCSGSGTLDLSNPKAMKAFSYELVKNSAKLQEELLRKAIRILKKGHEMVYSTCSILPMENENVVKKFLSQVDIIPIECKEATVLPTKLPGTIVVCPDETYEGFFIAKLRKK